MAVQIEVALKNTRYCMYPTNVYLNCITFFIANLKTSPGLGLFSILGVRDPCGVTCLVIKEKKKSLEIIF